MPASLIARRSSSASSGCAPKSAARPTKTAGRCPDEQLDDRHLVRRIILKRVIYGVDLNPMAVELAKLSLWLHSFTVGAPLWFLDHHLRRGNRCSANSSARSSANFTERYRLGVQPRRGPGAAGRRRHGAGRGIRPTRISARWRAAARAFAGVEEATTRSIRAFLDLTHTTRWLPPAGDAAQLRPRIAVRRQLRQPGPRSPPANRSLNQRRRQSAATARPGARWTRPDAAAAEASLSPRRALSPPSAGSSIGSRPFPV